MSKVIFERGYRGWATNEIYYNKGTVIDKDELGNPVYLLNNGIVSKVESYEDMEYRDLQALCKERDLNARGSTEELIERLKND